MNFFALKFQHVFFKAMKRSLEDTAKRFDEMSDEYDRTRGEAHHDTLNVLLDWAPERFSGSDHIVDIGAGTGMASFDLASEVDHVTALDISSEMLEKGREKAKKNNIENITFAQGRFRDPHQEIDLSRKRIDHVISNYAMHHLNEQEKRKAIQTIRSLLKNSDRSSDNGNEKHWFLLGDVILFEEMDDPREYYEPEVDDPSTIETLKELFQDEGFELSRVQQTSPASGVIETYLPG